MPLIVFHQVVPEKEVEVELQSASPVLAGLLYLTGAVVSTLVGGAAGFIAWTAAFALAALLYGLLTNTSPRLPPSLSPPRKEPPPEEAPEEEEGESKDPVEQFKERVEEEIYTEEIGKYVVYTTEGDNTALYVVVAPSVGSMASATEWPFSLSLSEDVKRSIVSVLEEKGFKGDTVALDASPGVFLAQGNDATAIEEPTFSVVSWPPPEGTSLSAEVKGEGEALEVTFTIDETTYPRQSETCEVTFDGTTYTYAVTPIAQRSVLCYFPAELVDALKNAPENEVFPAPLSISVGEVKFLLSKKGLDEGEDIVFCLSQEGEPKIVLAGEVTSSLEGIEEEEEGLEVESAISSGEVLEVLQKLFREAVEKGLLPQLIKALRRLARVTKMKGLSFEKILKYLKQGLPANLREEVEEKALEVARKVYEEMLKISWHPL